ncbi:hypothetical protein MTO96_040303 [Rhipicephalus appendiculatus]
MFVISEMSDSIRVPPWLFRVSPNEAIVEQLNRRLANKVVINVGLCIALYDITKIEDSRILPGDGSFHTTVQFRYVVFRPFMDEVLIGKIRSSSQEGIYVSMGFFEDILVTPDGMQHPARFDEKRAALGVALRSRGQSERPLHGPRRGDTVSCSSEILLCPYLFLPIYGSVLGVQTFTANVRGVCSCG